MASSVVKSAIDASIFSARISQEIDYPQNPMVHHDGSSSFFPIEIRSLCWAIPTFFGQTQMHQPMNLANPSCRQDSSSQPFPGGFCSGVTGRYHSTGSTGIHTNQ